MSVYFPNNSLIDQTYVPSSISIQAKEYLEEALEIMQTNSIKKNSIDWKNLRSKVEAQALGAQTPTDTYAAIRLALELLGDNHSFLWDPEKVDLYEDTKTDERSPKAELLEGHIGYLFLPGNNKFNHAANEYADSLQKLIRQLDSPKIDRWVIDLRENEGGNMWPMIAGLGPFFGDTYEAIGSFIDGSGECQKWYYREGSALCEDTTLCTASDPYRLINVRPKIALLIGANTASSGEAMTLALSHQNSKSFGANTAGLSTCNYSHKLKDGAVLWLTQSYFADRKNTIYGKEISPDVAIEKLEDKDNALQSALEWLSS